MFLLNRLHGGQLFILSIMTACNLLNRLHGGQSLRHPGYRRAGLLNRLHGGQLEPLAEMSPLSSGLPPKRFRGLRFQVLSPTLLFAILF